MTTGCFTDPINSDSGSYYDAVSQSPQPTRPGTAGALPSDGDGDER